MNSSDVQTGRIETRRHYRPPVGMPTRKQRSWDGVLVSILVHVLLVLLVITPLLSSDFSRDMTRGGMGPGPAGGGGGGAGGAEQRMHFVEIAAPPAAKAEEVTKKPAPPVLPKIEPKIELPKPEMATVQASSIESAVAASRAMGSSGNTATTGEGGGAGPGSGGGVGSGVGTGKGSANGAGTGGGGNQQSYSPSVVQLFVPPLPAPDKIKPYHLVAWFEVDSMGKSRLLRFNRSSDGDYNKRLESVLKSLRFRPGVRPDGTPKWDTTAVEYIF